MPHAYISPRWIAYEVANQCFLSSPKTWLRPVVVRVGHEEAKAGEPNWGGEPFRLALPELVLHFDVPQIQSYIRFAIADALGFD